MKKSPEFCFDPSFVRLPTGPLPAPRRVKKRYLAGFALLFLAVGFTGGLLMGAVMGRASVSTEALREAEIAVEVVEDLQHSVDFWRDQALACKGYDDMRGPIDEVK